MLYYWLDLLRDHTMDCEYLLHVHYYYTRRTVFIGKGGGEGSLPTSYTGGHNQDLGRFFYIYKSFILCHQVAITLRGLVPSVLPCNIHEVGWSSAVYTGICLSSSRLDSRYRLYGATTVTVGCYPYLSSFSWSCGPWLILQYSTHWSLVTCIRFLFYPFMV